MPTDQPDPLADAFQTLYDLTERYGRERTEEQHEMWWQIENAMEELADLGIAEGRRQMAAQIEFLTRGAYEDGKGDGRRLATDGWKREWGVRDKDGYVFREHDEDEAHRLADQVAEAEPVATVVSRLVGPWEPAEQPGGSA